MDTLLYFLKKYKFILVIVILLAVMFSVLVFKEENEDVVETVVNDIDTYEEVEESIKINIKGAVKNPGVYEIGVNSRVEDAIKISGGLTDDADTSIINLSKKLQDENVIIIYTKNEVKQIKKGNVVIQYIENECNCPTYENSACIDPDVLINNNEIETTGKVSLNKATIDELQTLSGIGESKAKSIIEYRNSNGGFKSIEEIKNVKGIGDAVFNKIKDNITI